MTEYGFDYDLSNINFSLLEQLNLMTPTSKSVNDILKTAKNFKKIAIGVNVKSEENTLITLKEMKDATSFRDDVKFLMSILDGIEQGVFKTKHLTRNQIKMHIIIEDI